MKICGMDLGIPQRFQISSKENSQSFGMFLYQIMIDWTLLVVLNTTDSCGISFSYPDNYLLPKKRKKKREREVTASG